VEGAQGELSRCISLQEAFAFAEENATSSVTIRVYGGGSGVHVLAPVVMSGSRGAQVREILVRGEEASVELSASSSADGAASPMLTVTNGAPLLRLQNLHIHGAVRVDGGQVRMENCTMTSTEGGQTRSLSETDESSAVLPALEILANESDVVVVRSVIEDYPNGAIVLTDGTLLLDSVVLRRNRAAKGGALRVTGGRVSVLGCTMVDNSAEISGGALQVDGGDLQLGNETLLMTNGAPQGVALEFTGGSLSYSLPAPQGRWILIPTGTTTILEPQSVDVDFPFACSAGIVGWSFDIAEQNGPWCSGVCPPGHWCGSANSEPVGCGAGTYCVSGSPAETKCPSGTWSELQLRTSLEDCEVCPAGAECAAGSETPVACAAGRFAASSGCASCSKCEAGKYQGSEGSHACEPCPAGAYCATGAAAPTPCPAGTWSDEEGMADDAGCNPCPLGFYCPEASRTPLPCAEGTIGQQERLTGGSLCFQCVPPMWSTPGSTRCTFCLATFFKAPQAASRTSGEDTNADVVVDDDGTDNEEEELMCDACFGGATCAANSSLATVELEPGRWRLSGASRVVSECVTVGNSTHPETGQPWSGPCRGGPASGLDGAGYCEPGHKGPLCEICEDGGANNATRWFDLDVGRCVDCPDLSVPVVLGVLLVAAAAMLTAGCYRIYVRPTKSLLRLSMLLNRILLQLQTFSLMPKVKLVIAFYQSVMMLPNVYNIPLPREYYQWMNVFDAIQLDWSAFFVPGACLRGGYLSRLLLKGFMPLGLMLLLLVGGWLADVVPLLLRGEKVVDPLRRLLKMLPAVLFVSFCLCASVSASIFAAWSCAHFQDDAVAGNWRSFLREDPSIRCSDETFTSPEHRAIAKAGLLLVLLWPVAMPLTYFAVLMPCRTDIKEKRSTALVRATAFLHREYKESFFWWEPFFLTQRLLLMALSLMPDRLGFVRVLSGLMLSALYCICLAVLKPYKQRSLDLLAIFAQFALTGVFLGATCIYAFRQIELEADTETAVTVLGFQSTAQIVWVVLVCNFSTVLMVVGQVSHQTFHSESLPTLRLVSTREPPDLDLSRGLRWHLFLSHVWSSGQDQVAVIKRTLQLLLPSLRVFLDVDDLKDTSLIEKYIDLSQCVLFFLSHGYFFSANCKREIRQALTAKKSICLVHERDMKKGGMPLSTLREDCPADMREDIFIEGREVVGYYRQHDFQVVSLKMIATATLQAMAKAGSRADLRNSLHDSVCGAAQSELYVPGELSLQRFELKRPLVLFVSVDNPGASEVADELVEWLASPFFAVTNVLARQKSISRLAKLGSSMRASKSDLFSDLGLSKSASESDLGLSKSSSSAQAMTNPPSAVVLPAESTSVEAASEASVQDDWRGGARGSISSCRSSRGSTDSSDATLGASEKSVVDRRRRSSANFSENTRPTHMLLYLNKETFLRDAGHALADQVRYARRSGLPLLMLHERDEDKGGLDFSHFFRATPEDLISGGIYNTLAVALHTEPHRLVSFCLASKAMGAANKSLVRAPTRSNMFDTMLSVAEPATSSASRSASPSGAAASGAPERKMSAAGTHTSFECSSMVTSSAV